MTSPNEPSSIERIEELARRAETLDVVDRHTLGYLFRDVATELWGGPRLKDWDAESARHHAWHRFFVLVTAEAWTDAALMVAPEGWEHYGFDRNLSGDVLSPESVTAQAFICDDAAPAFTKYAHGEAATPALALYAAALRARAQPSPKDSE